MSARKRHTGKRDYLRMIAKAERVASHCEGGWYIPYLEEFQKKGWVKRLRTRGRISSFSSAMVRCTIWEITEKGRAEVARLDGRKKASMRLHLHTGRDRAGYYATTDDYNQQASAEVELLNHQHGHPVDLSPLARRYLKWG